MELVIINHHERQNSCQDHGCSFLGIKETKEGTSVIRTGYVPIKDGKALCDANDKIVFTRLRPNNK